MSPVKIKKVDGYRVIHGGKVSAKGTTKVKAQAQANLLRGVAHGWHPTGAPSKASLKRELSHARKAGMGKK
mgnify:CR=1 FL=1